MSYAFDGGGGGGDRIVYSHSGGLTGFNGATQWSASVWVKWTGGAGSHQVFFKSDAPKYFRAGVALTDGGYVGGVSRDNATGTGTSGASQVSTGAWTHLFIVYDKGAGTSNWRVWVNASEITMTNAANDSYDLYNDSDLYVGRYRDDAFQFLGKIAELAFWVGEAITDSTIASLYNSGAGALASAVRPTGLDFYARYLADANDSAGSLTGTVTGATLDAADHPVASGGGATFVPQVIMVL